MKTMNAGVERFIIHVQTLVIVSKVTRRNKSVKKFAQEQIQSV